MNDYSINDMMIAVQYELKTATGTATVTGTQCNCISGIKITAAYPEQLAALHESGYMIHSNNSFFIRSENYDVIVSTKTVFIENPIKRLS